MTCEDSYIIRQPTKDEIVRVHTVLVHKQGWILQLEQVEVGYELNPTGCRVAQNDDGDFIGVCMGTIVSDRVAVIGVYIVAEEYRGRGIGLKLWKTVQANLGDRNIVLFAFDQHLYTRIGYKASHSIHFMSGIPLTNTINTAKPPSGIKTRRSDDVPVDSIIHYDQKINAGIPRRQFLRSWILHKKAFCLVAIGDQNAVAGFGCVRPCVFGWEISPLYADNTSVAKCLFLELLAKVPSGAETLFYPSVVNVAAMELAMSVGLEPEKNGRNLTFMYLTEMVDIPLDNVYSISTSDFSLV